jgi:hypothetical protein
MCVNGGDDAVHVDLWMAATCGRWSAGVRLGGHVASATSPPLLCVPTANPAIRGEPGRPGGLGCSPRC